jgi:hypothetical protein
MEGNGEPAAEAAVGCPAEEVADSVAALGVLLVEPSVEVVLLEVVLLEVVQGGFLGVDPGQEVEGDQDSAAQITADGGGKSVFARPASGSAQQVPVQERADEVGVLDRLVGQVVLQPGRNTFEVLVSFGEHPGLHHHLAEMLKSGTGRQFVEEVVTDRAAFGDELGQQLGVRMLVNPLDGLERRVSAGEAVRERLELNGDGPVRREGR